MHADPNRILSFVWQDCCRVDVPLIDVQHRWPFDLANSSLFAGDAADLTYAMARFLDCARVHFSAQDHLMRRVGYPGLRNHDRIHRLRAGRLVPLGAYVVAVGSPHDDLKLWMRKGLVGAIVRHVKPVKQLAEFVRAITQPPNG